MELEYDFFKKIIIIYLHVTITLNKYVYWIQNTHFFKKINKLFGHNDNLKKVGNRRHV